MRYFPIFYDLKDRLVVVVGGGEEALRKIRLLLKTEARINVIAPDLHDGAGSRAARHWLAKSLSRRNCSPVRHWSIRPIRP